MESSPIPERPWLRAGAILALALAAGFLVWLLAVRDHDDEPTAAVRAAAADGPVASSAEGLTALQGELGHPVYWVGEQEGSEIELTRTGDDRVYVRYLVEGAEVGDPRPEFLTVGTYPVQGAFEALEQSSGKPGATTDETPDGGLVVTDGDSPTSVYIAYPDQDLQIEVYDTDPARALGLAVSGDVRPAD